MKRTCLAAAAAGMMAAIAGTGSAEASVIYKFSGDSGSYQLTVPDILTHSANIPLDQLDSCQATVGKCSIGAQIRPGQSLYDVVYFTYMTPVGSNQDMYLFAPGALLSLGEHHTVQDPDFVGTGTGVMTIEKAAAAVPEPAAWALMILGFGGAGAALRRRPGSARPASHPRAVAAG